ncbi:coiled-coil domain-containing protein 42 homolog [Lingula anatina]|uniref:Coiled-coil domain-containing protein 42 homolog n=1 Tax=Lingula anatina TaxID=7574 RepID=A0A1S3H6L6_LINAN|nr:coiled-coil domain-containing protein 42 homolog [Lingula anatina]XP_013410511.1 coiled-coil domain-containing protein 42 homolog [Lingula anatina]|eukprot:XP_013381622.1 coiled-coil domain-containing protein 42 homolog [Lingula anatina]
MTVNLEEYFATTFEDKLLVKMPEREDDHLTPATRLLEKRREMAEVEQALAAQKEEFQMKMESLQQRREELERKEFQLKEALLKFDKFLKENDSKRSRAVKKANDEIDLRKQKEKDIDKLREETSEFAKQREKLQTKLEKHVIFQKYLDKVLETSEEFSEIREVIARYATLTATHEDLLERDQANQEKIEKMRQDLMKYTEDKHNEILGYNNRLSSLQTRLDKAQSAAVKWESKWTHIKNTAAKKTLILGQIKMATHNLFMLVNKHQKQGQTEMTEDTNEQLNKIQTFIQDLTQITTEIKRSEAAATSIGGTSTQ